MNKNWKSICGEYRLCDICKTNFTAKYYKELNFIPVCHECIKKYHLRKQTNVYGYKEAIRRSKELIKD
jgi:hypothetical protein